MTVLANVHDLNSANSITKKPEALMVDLDGECDPMFTRMMQSLHKRVKPSPEMMCFNMARELASNCPEAPIRKTKRLNKRTQSTSNSQGRYALFYKSFASDADDQIDLSDNLSALVVQGQIVLHNAVEGAVCYIEDLEAGTLLHRFRKMST